MSEHPSVTELLSRVMADVGAVRKNEVNKHQRFNFRGIDAVVNAVSPALRDHGVVVAPTLLEKEIRESRTAKGAVMVNVYLTVRYDFYGPAGDSISATVASESFDSGDKATAKAMSVAFRTALLQTLSLPTDEPDPDEHTYERSAYVAPPAPPTPASLEYLEQVADLADEVGLDEATLEKAVAHYSARRTTDISQLSAEEAGRFERDLRKRLAESDSTDPVPAENGAESV